MVVLGTHKRGRDLGYKGDRIYLWHACEGCGKERWVALKHRHPEFTLCRSCARRRNSRTGVNHPRWKGGHFQSNGYVFIYFPEHPQANCNGYIKLARLVLEQKLGRHLLPDEVTHHINGIKNDDMPWNLDVLKRNDHNRLHALRQHEVKN